MSDRIKEIEQALAGLPLIRNEVSNRMVQLTKRLIETESEATRGAIKELMYLIDDLPDALRSERADLAAGLPERSDPAQ